MDFTKVRICTPLLLGALWVSPALSTPIAIVDYVSGTSATIDRGLGAQQLMIGDEINLGDTINTNSDRLQFSYSGTYNGYARMSTGASAVFEVPPSPLVSSLPGLTFSANFLAGEVLLAGNGDGKYRTSCYIGRSDDALVFLQPGGTNTDFFYALDNSINVFDYQPITSNNPSDWTILLSLSAGEMASLTLQPTGFHTASAPQDIDNGSLLYIQNNYLDDSRWTVPEPSTIWLSIWLVPMLYLTRRSTRTPFSKLHLLPVAG